VNVQTSYFPHRFAAASCLVLALSLWSCSDTIGGFIPTKYIVTVSSTSLAAGDTVNVVAQLADDQSNPIHISGLAVSWYTNAKGHFTSTRSTTDVNGGVSIAYIDTVVGDAVRITAADELRVMGTSPAIKIAPGEPKQYVVRSSETSPVVGSTITLTAQLADRYTNPTRVAGRVVTWSIGSDAAGGAFASPTSNTNTDGVATVSFTVSTSAWTDYIIAAVDDKQVSGVSPDFYTAPGGPNNYQVTTPIVDPPAGATVVVTALVLDGYRNPITNQPISVRWSMTGSGGSLSALASTTDDAGYARVQLTTAAVAGTSYSVMAGDPPGAHGTSPTIITQQQMALASLAPGLAANSTCGTATDGNIWCWGVVDFAPFAIRPLPGKLTVSSPMSSLTTGYRHTCAISAGTVYCWGENQYNQLGDNTRTLRGAPTPINSSVAFASVSAGVDHTCGVAMVADIYCWGLPDSGRLGDAATGVGLGPTKVVGGLSFKAVSAGDAHTCAITTSGDAYCWGANEKGQLGNNTVVSASSPVPVGGGLKFTDISAGVRHTCGIAAGTVYCWGDHAFGQLGDGSGVAYRTTPTAVASPLTFTAIAAGGVHTCAIASGGSAFCWGDNSTFELGDPTFMGGRSTKPIMVANGLTFSSIAVGGGTLPSDSLQSYGFGHSCGLTTSGATYCWGSNSLGELGDSPLTSSTSSPTKVSGQH
jgi:alpha-tubulin suppressor-like RCC1 family protein